VNPLIEDVRHPDFDPDDPRHDKRSSQEKRLDNLEVKVAKNTVGDMDYGYNIPVRIAAIESDLKEIRETLTFVKDTLVNADTTITKVAAEVMPTINELMQSPMLKMLGVGKKK